MPNITQYHNVKQKVESFKQLGFKIEFEILGFYERFAPKIVLRTETKEYIFCDKNWDIVNSQLGNLLSNTCNRL
jgi:hypothetical protein